MATAISEVQDKEIIIQRALDFPADVVFEAWVNPAHVGHWFGPKGFKTTTQSMDVRPGGQWRYTMLGPDGTIYPNLVSYLEVKRPARLVYDLSSGEPNDPIVYHVTVTFEEKDGKTLLTLRMRFDSNEERDRVIREVHAIEGGRSTLQRLAEYLAQLATAPASDTTDREIVIERLLEAPPERVFEAWTDPAEISNWWGPRGFTTTTQIMEPRAGGEWRFTMHGPDGTDYPNVIHYVEATRPQRIVYNQGSDDPSHPIKFHVVVTFQPVDNKTHLTLRMVFATAQDRNYVAERYGAVEGGHETVARLAEYLETV